MKNDEIISRNPKYKMELQYIDIKKLIIFVTEKKWKIIIISLLFGFSVLIFNIFKLPTFKTSLLLDLNSSKGSATLSNLVSKINPILPQEDSAYDEESAIIRSYAVLAPVIKELKLDIRAEVKLFPIIGKLFYFNYKDEGLTNDGLAEPVMNLDQFAWGGEIININYFQVPDSMKGDNFTIVYLGENKFNLFDNNGNKLISGQMNEKLIHKFYKDEISINIKQIKARPGIKFNIKQLSMDNAIEDLLKNLNISSSGKKSDLISLSYQGTNPLNIAKILNAIAESAVIQDIYQKQEQAKRTLDFLRKHEPKVRMDLSNAETLLHEYRAKTGNVALDQETKITMDTIALLQGQISQLLIQKGQVEQKYTDQSLQIKDVNTTLDKLKQEKDKYEKKLKSLPNADQIALNLMRDVDIQNQIYVNLVEKIQQFELLKAGTVGDLSIISYAFKPLKPSEVSKVLLFFISVVLAGISSIAVILIRKFFFSGIQDPHLIEEKFNITCLASLNTSVLQKQQIFNLSKNKIKNLKFLTEMDSFDLTLESLRSLRTNLGYQNQFLNNKVVVFLSPKPNAGKTFISANFANVLAEAGKKVLLIDGDLRRGTLLNYFDSKSSPRGLSDLLTHNLNINDLILKTRIKNLDFLPRGNYFDKITSLIESSNIEQVIKSISPSYDYIVIDTPPILFISDAFHFCKYKAFSIIIFGNESHDEKEILVSLKKFNMSCEELNGFIFNNVSERLSDCSNRYSYKYLSNE